MSFSCKINHKDTIFICMTTFFFSEMSSFFLRLVKIYLRFDTEPRTITKVFELTLEATESKISTWAGSSKLIAASEFSDLKDGDSLALEFKPVQTERINYKNVLRKG